jgi:ABC-type sugar transport system ATPase subunit
VLLTLDGVALAPGVAPANLDVRAGEIVGLAGLEGHGQVAFLECAVGLARPAAGTVATPGGPIASFAGAARHGVIYLPRDRKSEGVFAPLSVLDNLTVSALARLSRLGVIRRRQRLAEARALIADTRVHAPSVRVPIAALSGGNQQKVLLGRLLAKRPRVLVLNDPMRGVDLGAKQDIYDILRRFAAAGGGVLLLSTELAELCLLCDRVAVYHDQAVSAVVERHRLAAPALIAAMFGRPEEAA